MAMTSQIKSGGSRLEHPCQPGYECDWDNDGFFRTVGRYALESVVGSVIVTASNLFDKLHFRRKKAVPPVVIPEIEILDPRGEQIRYPQGARDYSDQPDGGVWP